MPIDLDEYRQASHENWNRLAENWERNRDFVQAATQPINERMVERLDPGPGDTILDLAAGTGDTGFLAAERIGEEGKLISTDFAQGMVDAASRASTERGLENVEHRVLDAEKMDLEDDSVDGVICRFGYMLMADPAAALAETRRVLRDGKRVSLAVWAPPDKNAWAFIPAMELIQRGHLPPPEPGAPGIFAMADPDRNRELVTGAGFDEPETDEVPIEWPYVDADDHWRLTLELAGPLADALMGLDEAERESIRTAVREKIEPLIADGGTVAGLTYVITAS